MVKAGSQSRCSRCHAPNSARVRTIGATTASRTANWHISAAAGENDRIFNRRGAAASFRGHFGGLRLHCLSLLPVQLRTLANSHPPLRSMPGYGNDSECKDNLGNPETEHKSLDKAHASGGQDGHTAASEQDLPLGLKCTCFVRDRGRTFYPFRGKLICNVAGSIANVPKNRQNGADLLKDRTGSMPAAPRQQR